MSNFLLGDVLYSSPDFHLDQIDAIAKILLGKMQIPGITGFSGVLGAGKTELVRALMRQLGGDDDVSSPSYVLENIYAVRGVEESKSSALSELRFVSHWDFYRLSGQNLPEEFYDYEVNPSILVLVEWPEFIPAMADLLSNHVHIAIHPSDNSLRRLELYAGNQPIICSGSELT
ncbi:MAG: tRNA (adenosine(37)-N6)-threonylcarbamoyltransferase complex ATPase subunit type 1 TsaE [bacterium]|nr:tRNA (adenosine(37)-N6)-threonylcarbamoyltransferase complex ATPase subunit type 1 TsaE [bacterium]